MLWTLWSSRLEAVKEDDPENLESINLLEQEYGVILGEVCEREAAKLKTFKILHDEKPSKGMIQLEKKLSGYTNITMIYDKVKPMQPLLQVDSLVTERKTPRGKS